MALKPAICTQCGANIEVDDSKEAGICKYCGTAFITEKVIANYNYTTVHNITNNVTKIINGKAGDDAEDFFNRGLTNLKLKKYVDARDNFEEAIKLSPEVSKYYMYSYIAKTYNFTHTPYPFDLEGQNDLTSFFALTTEEEKEQFESEYGMDCSCYEAFLVDSTEALYLKDNFGSKFNSKNVLRYDVDSLNYVIRVFKLLKQDEYKQKLEEKIFKSICEILKDFREGSVDNIKYALDSIDYVYILQKSYPDVDIFCIALYERFKQYMPSKKEQIYDLLAQRMYRVDKNTGTLYLKSIPYLPLDCSFATIVNPGTFQETRTIKVDDPSIHTIVFGGDARYFGKFVLTKNITEIREAGVINVDFSQCLDRYYENYKENVDYFVVEPGCNPNTVKSIKDHFIVEEDKRIEKEQEKLKNQKRNTKEKAKSKVKKIAIFGIIAFFVILFIVFVVFGVKNGL